MSDDDIVARLRGGTERIHSTLDRYEAADEIERLRAELAAEREGCAQYKRDWQIAIDELAAAKKSEHQTFMDAAAINVENDRLRADLEDEKAARAYHQKMSVDLFDENVRLRALLREARDWTWKHNSILPGPLVARMDAALNKEDVA